MSTSKLHRVFATFATAGALSLTAMALWSSLAQGYTNAPPLSALPPPGPAGWETASFVGTDVGVSGTGSQVVYIGTDGARIVRHAATGDVVLPGSATRVAVDPSGHPWVVNAGKQIYRDVSTTAGTTSWKLMPGAATDIGIGSNGTVWVIGTDGTPWRWDDVKAVWVQGTGRGTNIAVDPSGNPWVVNAGGETWQYAGTAWTKLPSLPSGTATDIGIKNDGSAYVVGSDGKVWNWSSGAWRDTNVVVPGGRISAGAYAYVISPTLAYKTSGAP